jgi:hypothetical protein
MNKPTAVYRIGRPAASTRKGMSIAAPADFYGDGLRFRR